METEIEVRERGDGRMKKERKRNGGREEIGRKIV
jgi:hypothetical protein